MTRRTTSTIPFTVTEDHVALLKRLSVNTRVYVNEPGDRPYRGTFTCRPNIDQKRPFGNSGDPAVDALNHLGIDLEAEAARSAAWEEYARMLLIELPLAYEAVMAHGTVEPCTERLDPYSAWFEYQSRRALEYWRDAIHEIAGHTEDVNLLILFAVNADMQDPVAWTKTFKDMAENTKWVSDAYAVLEKHLVRKWRAANPGHDGMRDDDVLTGLMSGRLALQWPGPATRPDGKGRTTT